MSLSRSVLLAASQNQWIRRHASRYGFMRRTVSRFMPGEKLEDVLAAAEVLQEKKIGTVITYLGENVKDVSEAKQVAQHYIKIMESMQRSGMTAEVSVKLTQLGLEHSEDACFENLKIILDLSPNDSTVWIDMESSSYVDSTLTIFRRALQSHRNVALCLQAYLFRTKEDFASLLSLRPSIRLVKGAYKEPASVAFPEKQAVDENFFSLACEMIRAKKENRLGRAAFGTHDPQLIRRITEFSAGQGLAKEEVEVHMLYGIQRSEQERLAREGWRSIVLIAYGSYWYPWFMRRLAERPANAWFLLKNLF